YGPRGLSSDLQCEGDHRGRWGQLVLPPVESFFPIRAFVDLLPPRSPAGPDSQPPPVCLRNCRLPSRSSISLESTRTMQKVATTRMGFRDPSTMPLIFASINSAEVVAAILSGFQMARVNIRLHYG